MPFPFSGPTNRTRTAVLRANATLAPHGPNNLLLKNIGGAYATGGGCRVDAYGFTFAVGVNYEGIVTGTISYGNDPAHPDQITGVTVATFTTTFAAYQSQADISILPPVYQTVAYSLDTSSVPSIYVVKAEDHVVIPKSYPAGTLGQGLGLAPVTINWNGSWTVWVKLDGLPQSGKGYVNAFAQGSLPNDTLPTVGKNGTTLISKASLFMSVDSMPWGTQAYDYKQNVISQSYKGSISDGFHYAGDIISGQIEKQVGVTISATATDYGMFLGVNPYDSLGLSWYSHCTSDFLYNEAHLPVRVEGDVWCFADEYPGKLGLLCGGFLPNGGVQSVEAVRPTLTGSQTEITVINLPGFSAPDTGVGTVSAKLKVSTLSGQGDSPDGNDIDNNNIGGMIGQTMNWPAMHISHAASLPLKPDTWVGEGTTSGMDWNGGGFASNSSDVVLDAKWKAGVMVMAYRFLTFDFKAEDQTTVDTLTVSFQGREWQLDPSDGPKEIDLCFAPTMTASSKEDPGTTWPLNYVTAPDGSKHLIPVDRAGGFGACWDSKLRFVATGSGRVTAFSVQNLKLIRKNTPIFEALAGGDNSGYSALYFPKVSGNPPSIAKRGFICLVDGRIAAEVPVDADGLAWSVTQMVAWLNSIPGFKASVLDSGYPVIDNKSPYTLVADIAHGGYWNGTKWVDQTTIIQDAVTIHGSLRYGALIADRAQGDLDSGIGYGDGSKATPFRYLCHLRSKAWGCDPGTDKVSVYNGKEAGGFANANDIGYWETALPYMRVPPIGSSVNYKVKPGDAPIVPLTNARVHVRARSQTAIALESGVIGYFIAYATSSGLYIDRRWSSTSTKFDQFTIDSNTDVVGVQLQFVAKGILHCLYQRQSGKTTDTWLAASADWGETWTTIPSSGGPLMPTISSAREVYLPRTREVAIFSQDDQGAVTVDIYDISGNFVDTWPQDEPSIGSYAAPSGGWDAKHIIDGHDSVDVILAENDSYRRYRSTDECRSWSLLNITQ